MRLSVLLHDELAVELQADPRQRAAILTRGAAMRWLSAAWTGDEGLNPMVNWLEALLPESGKLERWLGQTRGRLLAGGVEDRPHIPETTLWMHADAEFAGAVSLVRDQGSPRKALPMDSSAYRRLDEKDVGRLLLDENQLAGRAKGSPRGIEGRARSSLSGMRPKITLTAVDGDPDRGWAQGEPGQLNTWIVKHEHSPNLPGEAGVEAVCQSALDLAGVPAARTLSRVIDGMQCVLSERSDRAVRDGAVVPVHQEDYRQAAGKGIVKFREAVQPRSEWPFAYRLLDGEAEREALTRFLAGSWLLAHCDLHRGNLGFTITQRGAGPKRASVAPAYDVSSAVGTKLSARLEFPIAAQGDPAKISVRQWAAHARECGIEEDATLEAVSSVARAMPGALAQAMADARAGHENIRQDAVDARCAAVMGHVVARADRFEQDLARRMRRAFDAPGP